jgi:glyoxylase-like metal-dependent hydrolase (beta-lactamase superfamily II)
VAGGYRRHAAGHTSGSVIVFVTLPGDQRYAFIGDLTWQLESITERRQRPWLMRRLADSDPASIQRDIDRIAAIADAVHVVPSHDLSSYAGIPELSTAIHAAAEPSAVPPRNVREQATRPGDVGPSGDPDGPAQ